MHEYESLPSDPELCKRRVVRVHDTKAYMESRSTPPFILNLGNRWRRVGHDAPAALPPEKTQAPLE